MSGRCECGRPAGQCTKGDLDWCGAWQDDFPEDDLEMTGLDCGRWVNGRLGRACSLAGTEYCDFECPYRELIND